MKKNDLIAVMIISIVLFCWMIWTIKLNIECRAKDGVLVLGLGKYVCIEKVK